MANDDITILVLREIRDEMKGMRDDMQGMRDEQRGMRLDLGSVERRLETLETTLATEIVGFRRDFIVVRDLLVGRRDLRPRVDRLEADVAELKRRVP